MPYSGMTLVYIEHFGCGWDGELAVCNRKHCTFCMMSATGIQIGGEFLRACSNFEVQLKLMSMHGHHNTPPAEQGP
jgi:hypothetical protein